MKKEFILLLCVYGWALGKAQLYDAQWVLGPNTSNIDFRGETPVNDSIGKWMGMRDANAAICDSTGDLLFYTNGIYIAGKRSDGDSILNGNDLNPCSFTDQYHAGLPLTQACLFLVKPGDSRYFYLIHFSGDTSGPRPGTLYYSLIDKNANFGLGEVLQKNVIVYKDIFRPGGISACKHANGRDCWIVVGRANSNKYYKFLLSPNGISDTLQQTIGPVYLGPLDLGYSRFSSDGTKYVTGTAGGVITVMDFDRCTGEFSNPVMISNINPPATGSGITSVEFSPNGRFIYAADRLYLIQYDLNSVNPHDSAVTIFACGCPDGGQLNQFELAPNGKIYGSTWAGGFWYLHVINQPNEKGLDCNFIYGGQPTLSANSINVSNTANPRLGPLAGSGCDTILTGIPKADMNSKQRIQPNPANKFMYVEMPMHGNYVFELVNEMGQIVDSKETRQVDIFNTENLPNGVYFLKVIDSRRNTPAANSRQVVIQH